LTRRRAPRERGVALILVLWVFMTLGVLALDFSQYMRDDALASLNLADETRGYYLAVAGMNRAIFDATRELEEEKRGHDPNNPQDVVPQPDQNPDEQRISADGQWHEETLGDGKYKVRMTDEAGRISLNQAPEDLIRLVVKNLVRGGNATTGVDRDTQKQIDTIADSILDWRDCDKEVRANGAETEYYMGLPHPYRPKNGYFESVGELLYVRGVTPDVFYAHDGEPGLVDIFSTAVSENHHLNPKTATPEVLQAILGISHQDVMDLLTSQDEDASDQLKAQLVNAIAAANPENPELAQYVNESAPDVVRIEARGDVSAKRSLASVAAVVKIAGGDTEGPRVVQWLDRAPVYDEDVPPTAAGPVS
jgi:general secretion pathway protein K